MSDFKTATEPELLSIGPQTARQRRHSKHQSSVQGNALAYASQMEVYGRGPRNQLAVRVLLLIRSLLPDNLDT